MAERYEVEPALGAQQPLRALWNLNSDRSRAALTMEFVALANQRKVVQAEIAAAAERFRSVEVAAMTRLFEERGIAPQTPPLVVAVLLTSLARGLVQERALGVAEGHAPTLAFVEACLRLFEETGGAHRPVLPMVWAQRQPNGRKRTPKAMQARANRPTSIRSTPDEQLRRHRFLQRQVDRE